jgi:hypothetical protein
VPIFARGYPASADGRVIDQFEDAPNAWTFGVYFQGELYSSIA